MSKEKGNYLNYSSNKKSNLAVQHSFNLVFRKVETVFFCFLCICLLVIAKTNQNLSQNISFLFLRISSPVVFAASYPFNSLIDLLTDFHELSDAKRENAELKKEIEKLRAFEITAINSEAENKELLETLNFIKLKTTSYRLARVIGISNQAFSQKVFIDIGQNNLAKEGQMVVGKLAVIGRVHEIVGDKARLLLLTDALSKIPVISSKTRLRGILTGNNSELMEIQYLPKGNQIEVGEEIFTSGDGDTLPPGLLVGVVKKIDKDLVYIAMAENVNNLNFVSIVDF